MSGIYIHIPYCKTICHYCDFYKTANLATINNFIDALEKEIVIRKNFIQDKFQTVYFGGGTPSLLSIQQLAKILQAIKQNCLLEDNCEITIEMNPDDINVEYLEEIKSIGVNRISIGVQSFDDHILKFLNRRHHSKAAIKSIEFALNAGFTDISLDLIYGIPGQSIITLKKDLKIVEESGVNHLSAYHLGIEENSYFGKLQKSGRFKNIDENESQKHYNELVNWSEKSGFEQYEVSNFAKNNQYSRHNKSYWFSVPYIGFGPSAHSFNGELRSFNLSNVNQYIKNVSENSVFYETERLSAIDKLNEYILLRLRTKWGINIQELNQLANTIDINKLLRSISKFEDSNYLRIINDNVILTKKGFFASDYIIRELFIVA